MTDIAELELDPGALVCCGVVWRYVADALAGAVEDARELGPVIGSGGASVLGSCGNCGKELRLRVVLRRPCDAISSPDAKP